MLHTRLWMGAVLVALSAGVLVVDQWLAPWYPFLLLLTLGMGFASCRELLQLLGAARRLPGWLCQVAVLALLLTNWLTRPFDVAAWPCIAGVFAGIVLTVFLVEMAGYRQPDDAVVRMALVVWIVGYLGLLPSFLLQLRWLGMPEATNRGTIALALAIFVPKGGDIGAYFTGRLVGKHRMTPLLSPKKTWEGAAGGLMTSVLIAIGINRLGPALTGGLAVEVGFGVTVGIIGMLGDLAESLIKRDCQQKDASQVLPGFGGVLDVVDSLLFAGPVAYWWLS